MMDKNDLRNVRFTDEKARKMAEDAGLSETAFEYDDPTGPDQTYTRDDVMAIIRSWA